MDNFQTTPSFNLLISDVPYTNRQWLQYYRNLWGKNRMALCIDVLTDTHLKSKNKEEMVQHEDGRMMRVAERLEHRKVKVENANNMLVALDALLAMKDEEIAEVYSEKALEIADDMLPGSNDIRDFTFLKDFGDFKAGETVNLPNWNIKDIDARIADGLIKVAEPVKLTSYLVQAGKQIQIGPNTYTETTEVPLDADAEQTKAWLADGSIALKPETEAPAAAI